jgi:hypothetical protein
MCSKLLKASVIFGLLAILLGMPMLLTPHRIRPSSCDRITLGMTEQEVEDLLGAKAGNYDGYVPPLFAPTAFGLAAMRVPKTWCSRNGTVYVYFEGGRVFHTAVGHAEPADWWAKMLHRLFPPAET